MQNTTHYNLKKPDYTDFADIQDINDNMDTIDEKLAAPTGDARNQVVSFTDADLDTGITSFPTFLTKIVSGMKMAKFLRDFKAGMAYVLHVGDLINNATCTESGKALDARMGKTLQDQITSLNDSLTKARSNGTYNENFQVFAYGFITSDKRVMHLCIPMLFKVTASSISFSKLIASFRTSTGGYVVDDGTNIASYITQTNFYGDRGYAYLVLRKNDEWAVINNSTFCGLVTIGYTIS